MPFVPLYRAGGIIEAESLRAALLDAEIDCRLDGAGSDLMPGLITGWNMSPVGVVVAEADFERAWAIVESWQASLPQPEESAVSTPRKPAIQYSLQSLLIVMTVSAVVCGISYHLGWQWLALLVGTVGELFPTILIIAGYLRKRRQLQEYADDADDETVSGDLEEVPADA